MKNSIKIFSLLAASGMLTLTSCIDETFPESSTATSEQVGASATSLVASLNGVPAQQVQGYLVYGDQVHETDMAYPQYMMAQTELLGDIYPEGSNSGYDWYRNYNTCDRPFGKDSYFSYLPWRTGYMFVKSANDIIKAVDVETATDEMKVYLGIAYAERAFAYYTLTTFYEPVENIYTDISKVKGLTVPIVTETTTGEEGKNNPRATHDEMIKFMLDDLSKAEEYIGNNAVPSTLFPSLACVYGLKARVYMWDEDYANAATYARMAIDTFGGTPVTESEWLDPTTGFNTENQAWMWKLKYSAETMGNLCNWIGWISGEADWGYSSLTCPAIDKSLYDKIAYTDFRKYTFLDPDRTVYNYQSPRGQEWLNDQPDYLSLKFRCGNGDYEDYTAGAAIDVPVMRVEEFYLIEAEALAHTQGVETGKAKLIEFMQNYRQPDYVCKATELRDFQKEVLAQMRIEFWGEGEAFPAAKRIKPDVVQNYEGTNAPANIFKINFKGIKPWWNFVIPQYEIDGNPALTDTNNPDPTGCFTAPIAVGEFAPGKY